MFTLHQLADRISDCVAGRLRVSDFEGWFALESRGFRSWGDDQAIDVVDAIEDVFSQYHFEGIPEGLTVRELESIIAPFVPVDKDTTVVRFRFPEADDVPFLVSESVSPTLEQSAYA